MKVVIAGLVILVLALVALAPAVLVSVAAVRYKRNVEDASGWIILIAGFLFSVLALSIFGPFVLSILLWREPEALAAASMFVGYADSAVTYIAVLLLGLGLWIRSGKMRPAQGQGHPIPPLQRQGDE